MPDVIEAWTQAARDRYAEIERQLFGLPGLRTSDVRRPGPAVQVTVGGKEIARILGGTEGLTVVTTVPKRFKEAALTLEGLTDTVRRGLKAADRASIEVHDAEDARAASAVIRAKAAFVAR